MEQEWIKRALQGDEEAFTLLVDKYKGYLMAVILPIVGDPDQAQDVLQETFWQVYRSLPRYQGGNIKIWLARIATHKAIDWQRKREREKRTVAAISSATRNEVPSLSAEEEYLDHMTGEKLSALVSGLPPPYKLTLSGYLVEGKNYRELADEAGVTVKTVESRLYRARQILKEQLKEGM